MTPSERKDVLALAQELSERAGEIILGRWGRATSSRKADGSEVTDADLAAEEFILGQINRRFGDHAVLAEESAGLAEPGGGSRYCWIVDPLDGTRNFTRGFPCFATSIALTEDGVPVVGVVREHVTDRVYAAAAGLGASVDGTPVRLAERPLDRDFFVGVPSVKLDESPAVIRALLETVNVRNIGSTATHLALVATGGIDAAYALRCYSWDTAAGYLLVREAGGVCTHPNGGPCLPLPPVDDPASMTPVLAAGPTSHTALVEMIRRGDRRDRSAPAGPRVPT